MQKKKRILACICAFALTATSLGVTDSIFTQAEESTTTFSGEYADGEAIIITSGGSNSVSSFKQSILNNVSVEDSYTFQNDTETTKGLFSTASSAKKGMTYSVVSSDTLTTEQLVSCLQNESSVLYAQPNYQYQLESYSDDTYSDYQWALDNSGQFGGTVGDDCNFDNTTLSVATTDEQVIAIVDTGFDDTHPDLQDHIWDNPFYGTGKLKGKHGYSFAQEQSFDLSDFFATADDEDTSQYDHGTHVAGIIAATADNNEGVCGAVSKSTANIKLMNLAVADSEGYMYTSSLIGAYNYIYTAMNLGVNVVAINDSWGGYEQEDADVAFCSLIDLIGEMGAISCFAAGNESCDVVEDGEFPASYDSDYMINVAASDSSDQLASFSNYNGSCVDLAAPGVKILSSVSEPVFNPDLMDDTQKAQISYYNQYNDPSVDATNLVKCDTETDGEGTQSVSIKEGGANGGSDDYSLEYKITGAKAGDTYCVKIPLNIISNEYYAEIRTDLSIITPDTEDTFELIPLNAEDDEDEESSGSVDFISIGIEEDYSDGTRMPDDMYYTLGSMEEFSTIALPYGFEEENSEKYLFVDLECGNDGDYTVSFDNLAYTDGTIDSETLMVQYDYYDGTSMATPYVTAAMGLVAAAYPDKTALERKSLLLGMTRYSSALEGLVSTSGVLDLSYAATPNPQIDKAELDTDNNTIVVSGTGLDQMTYSINDTAVTYTLDEDGNAVFDVADYANISMTFQAVNGERTYTKDFYYTLDETPEITSTFTEDFIPTKIFSINDTFYAMDVDGQVAMADESYDWSVVSQSTISETALSESESYMDSVSTSLVNTTAYGDYILALVYVDLGFTYRMQIMAYETTLEDFLFDEEDYSDMIVGNDDGDLLIDTTIATDEEESTENTWTILTEVPSGDDYMGTNEAMEVLGDKLYLIGGMDANYNACDGVFSYDLVNDEWATEASLPNGAMAMQTVVIGDQIYCFGGNTDKLAVVTDEDGNMDIDAPSNTAIYAFDGTKWTTLENANSLDEDGTYAGAAYEDITIIAGTPIDELGDIFLYDMESGELTASGLGFTLDDGLTDVDIAVVGDVLAVLYTGTTTTQAGFYSLTDEPLVSDSSSLGDVDESGEVDITDAFMTLLAATNISAGLDADLTDNGYMAADVDNDGEITATDAFLILDYVSNVSAGTTDLSLDEYLNAVG